MYEINASNAQEHLIKGLEPLIDNVSNIIAEEYTALPNGSYKVTYTVLTNRETNLNA